MVTGPSGAGKTTVARLVAGSFGLSAHIQSDAFMPFVVRGWVDPWLDQAADQNEVMGGAVAAAAIRFALGGYTVVYDGHIFPDGLEGLASVCAGREVPLHYAVLRTDRAVCMSRFRARPIGVARPEYVGFDDTDALGTLYDRFLDLGRYETHVVDASGTPEQVAAGVLAAFREQRLVV